MCKKGAYLLDGSVRSCGCLHNPYKGLPDGLRVSHKGMINRCDNSSHDSYPEYCGRGIGYIAEWKNLLVFATDMLPTWFNGAWLDRIDPNGDYSKTNCRWITATQQQQNKRKLKRNTTGITGVFFCKERNAWCATWSENGVPRKKEFSLRKYGDEAKELAIRFRAEVIRRLVSQGAAYTKYHGE